MIEIEFILALIFIALCVIASRLRKLLDVQTKSERHLEAMRKYYEPAAEKPLTLDGPRREALRR